MAQHQLVKPEKLVSTAIGMLEARLVVPGLFTRTGVDQFKGAENDSISFAVEGVLPFHTYEWRNDRSQPIVFDTYAERKISISFSGNYYSGVRLTDEQWDFDVAQWAKLLTPQSKAVARGLSRKCVATLTGQTYNVTIGNALGNMRGAIIEAERVLDAFHAPGEDRYMLVGSNFRSVLLSDKDLNLAQNVGDRQAETSLTKAVLDDRYGFRIVKSNEIGPNDAYAFSSSGFVLATAAPSVPQSVPFGATTTFEDYALRWVRDYDSAYMQDRSVVNCYAGTRTVTDILVGWDEANQTEVVSTGEHFVRGIKLTLDGSSNYPPAAGELAKITGISDADVWTPTKRAPETDPANA